VSVMPDAVIPALTFMDVLLAALVVEGCKLRSGFVRGESDRREGLSVVLDGAFVVLSLDQATTDRAVRRLPDGTLVDTSIGEDYIGRDVFRLMLVRSGTGPKSTWSGEIEHLTSIVADIVAGVVKALRDEPQRVAEAAARRAALEEQRSRAFAEQEARRERARAEMEEQRAREQLQAARAAARKAQLDRALAIVLARNDQNAVLQLLAEVDAMTQERPLLQRIALRKWSTLVREEIDERVRLLVEELLAETHEGAPTPLWWPDP